MVYSGRASCASGSSAIISAGQNILLPFKPHRAQYDTTCTKDLIMVMLRAEIEIEDNVPRNLDFEMLKFFGFRTLWAFNKLYITALLWNGVIL